MSYNVSSLSQYVDQRGKDILFDLVAGGEFLNSPFGTIRVVEGVKDGTLLDIHVGTNTLEFQAGTCVNTPSGGTTFDKVQIGTTLFTHYAEFCGQDLASKFPVLLRAGAESQAEWPETIMRNYIEQANSQVNLAYWRAGYNSYSTDLNLNGGGILYRLIRTSLSASTYTVAGVNQLSTLGYAFSAANAINTLKLLAAQRPASTYAAPVEFRMGPESFEQLKFANVAANLYHFAPSADPYRMPIDGMVNAYAVCDFGLAGAKAIVAITPDSIAFGCDLVSDIEDVAFGYDRRDNIMWMRIGFSIGAQVLKENEIGVITWA